MVTSFKYMGRVISVAEYNWPAVVMAFSRERAVWRSMTRILIWERAVPRVSGLFFKAVVQAVLLFGLET